MKMSIVHEKIDGLIEDICVLSRNLSKLICVNPDAAMDGLTMIKTNVKIINTLIQGLVRKE